MFACAKLHTLLIVAACSYRHLRFLIRDFSFWYFSYRYIIYLVLLFLFVFTSSSFHFFFGGGAWGLGSMVPQSANKCCGGFIRGCRGGRGFLGASRSCINFVRNPTGFGGLGGDGEADGFCGGVSGVFSSESEPGFNARSLAAFTSCVLFGCCFAVGNSFFPAHFDLAVSAVIRRTSLSVLLISFMTACGSKCTEFSTLVKSSLSSWSSLLDSVVCPVLSTEGAAVGLTLETGALRRRRFLLIWKYCRFLFWERPRSDGSPGNTPVAMAILLAAFRPGFTIAKRQWSSKPSLRKPQTWTKKRHKCFDFIARYQLLIIQSMFRQVVGEVGRWTSIEVVWRGGGSYW